MREIVQVIVQLSVQDFILSSILALGLGLIIARIVAPRRNSRPVVLRVVSERNRARREK